MANQKAIFLFDIYNCDQKNVKTIAIFKGKRLNSVPKECFRRKEKKSNGAINRSKRTDEFSEKLDCLL